MASTSTRPQQYVTSEFVCSTAPIGIDFTFDANQVVLINDKATPVYASLDSTSGSTGGWPLKANESLTLGSLRCGRMSLASTSTSTGDSVRVGAWSW